MIRIRNLTKNLSGEPLLEKISFTIHKGEKVGLVGPNGSGKTTLLKLIVGEVEPDGGTIETENERIGYLPQQILQPAEEGARQSSGQKTRAALEQLFARKPTLLLLDEPSNHLDLEAMQWLENALCNFRGGILIVSHDRRLLNNTVGKITELDPVNHALREYTGNYSDYVAQRADYIEKQEEAYRLQQKEKRRLEQWLTLKRQEAHIYVDPAKGKMIRAMERRLEREIYSQEIKRPLDSKKISGLELKGEAANPKLILRATNICKKFGEQSIFWNVNLELRGKERVVITGPNGSGKTTLLKIITGELPAEKGEVKIGEQVRIGYFAQEHESLNPNKTVLEEFLSTDWPHWQGKDPRAILGAFLFSGQSVFKKVSSLSLGERVRLIFAKLTNQKNELLILDEPSNHLDIASREIIENALREYQGAILVISHDRYFLESIGITRTLTLGNGKLL